MRRAKPRPPTPCRPADPSQGCDDLLAMLTGTDEYRRVTALAVVVEPMEGRNKRLLAGMLVDSLRRASPARRSPAVESLAAIGPDAADAIGCGFRSSKGRAFVIDMMRAAELLAPRLDGTDRLSLETCLYLAVRKRSEPEVLLAFRLAAAAFLVPALPGRG